MTSNDASRSEFEVARLAKEMEADYNLNFGPDAVRPDFMMSARIHIAKLSDAEPDELAIAFQLGLEHGKESSAAKIANLQAQVKALADAARDYLNAEGCVNTEYQALNEALLQADALAKENV